MMLAALLLQSAAHTLTAQDKKWTEKKAQEWYARQGWLSGCNYQPSTAINQLEMFQKESFRHSYDRSRAGLGRRPRLQRDASISSPYSVDHR